MSSLFKHVFRRCKGERELVSECLFVKKSCWSDGSVNIEQVNQSIDSFVGWVLLLFPLSLSF
jgi:hypothetical protein